MPKMKLLVLAQTPPPVHGQSVMVRTLVSGLPSEGIALEHVDLRLSRSAAEIGTWRLGKILAVLDACFHAVVVRGCRGCDTLYYVPAPGKRGALYRDWVVMLLCRPFFRRLVLHWHATGLGEWLATRATGPERLVTRWLLGRADLAIVLTDGLRVDAEALDARKVCVVANGIDEPTAGCPAPGPDRGAPFTVLFLGLCCEKKGLFDAAEAVVAANRRTTGAPFRLVAAGSFPDAATRTRFSALAAAHPQAIRHAGFVAGAAKQSLLRSCGCLCLPTRFPNEGQPLVLLEALAADRPVVATRWRGIAETLPPTVSRLVKPGDVAALADALVDVRVRAPAAGAARAAYLARFTAAHHLRNLATALASA